MTHRTYETMVLLDNQEVKRNWPELKEQVCGLFTKHGAEIKSAKVWEERRLAYPIKHHLRATYFLVYHEGDTDAQAAINRDLTFAEPVLRHLSIACEEIPADALEGADDFDPEQVRFESSYREPDAPVVDEEADVAASDEGGFGDESDEIDDSADDSAEADEDDDDDDNDKGDA